MHHFFAGEMKPRAGPSSALLRRVLGFQGAAHPPAAAGFSGISSGTPSPQQFRAHALQNAVPMIGFGVVDCVVMTQVGSTMDAVLGATLGISSITAAAIGLFCSDSCGVLFGGTIESFAGKLGLPAAHLTAEQLEMSEAKRAATFGRLFGVQLGVILGSSTLLLQSPKQEDGLQKSKAEHIAELPGTDVDQTLNPTEFETLTSSGVVVFTYPGCPFSRAAADKLLERGVSFKMASFDQFRSQLQDTGSTAAPAIWISGKYIGDRVQEGTLASLP